MKKSHPHTDLSTKKCSTIGCDRKLKKRIVEDYPNVDKCFKCIKAGKIKKQKEAEEKRKK